MRQRHRLTGERVLSCRHGYLSSSVVLASSTPPASPRRRTRRPCWRAGGACTHGSPSSRLSTFCRTRARGSANCAPSTSPSGRDAAPSPARTASTPRTSSTTATVPSSAHVFGPRIWRRLPPSPPWNSSLTVRVRNHPPSGSSRLLGTTRIGWCAEIPQENVVWCAARLSLFWHVCLR